MSTPRVLSKLEAALDKCNLPIIDAEHEIDTLRSVLRREFGTEAQRNALIRIITQNKVRKPILLKLLPSLCIHPLRFRSTYITSSPNATNQEPRDRR